MDLREKKLGVSLTPIEEAEVEKAATLLMISKSQLVRMAVFNFLQKEVNFDDGK